MAVSQKQWSTDGKSNDGGPREFDQRDYLRAIEVAGTFGMLGTLAGSTTGNVVAQRANDWETEADANTEEHRTGGLEVEVVDSTGQPVSNAEGTVEMQDHEFGFGTTVDVNELVNARPDDLYRQNNMELSNDAFLENYRERVCWEDNQTTADEATQWLVAQGLDVRGRTCVWGDRDTAGIPVTNPTTIPVATTSSLNSSRARRRRRSTSTSRTLSMIPPPAIAESTPSSLTSTAETGWWIGGTATSRPSRTPWR